MLVCTACRNPKIVPTMIPILYFNFQFYREFQKCPAFVSGSLANHMTAVRDSCPSLESWVKDLLNECYKFKAVSFKNPTVTYQWGIHKKILTFSSENSHHYKLWSFFFFSFILKLLLSAHTVLRMKHRIIFSLMYFIFCLMRYQGKGVNYVLCLIMTMQS